MIRETTIDRSLNRLIAHFGKRLLVRPPATAAAIASIEESVGPLPRDLVIFLSACDGLHLNVPGLERKTRFCTTQDILPALRHPDVPAPPPGFVPLRCDPQELDWLVLDEPPMHGVVLRWEPGTHGEELIAASFGAYLDAWSHYLVDFLTPEGGLITGKPRQTFDATHVARYHSNVEQMPSTESVWEYCSRLELLAAGGEDFE